MESDEEKESFNLKLLHEIKLVKSYEVDIAKATALSCIPYTKLKERAISVNSSAGEEPLKDLIFMELLKWFKEEFFTWYNVPVCLDCGGRDTFYKDVGSPTIEERKDGATIVELFECPSCLKSNFRFPRFLKPTKLLKTRKGRCGEWANCFALLVRSLEYEVRHVIDWTDHAWVEIFSYHQDRWIHVDPCENIVDKPLLYELGWGKKLSYVIATSVHDMQDVTPRYVINFECTKSSKRNKVPEKWLTAKISKLSNFLLIGINQSHKEFLIQRRLKELVELMTLGVQTINEDLPERQSGSKSWKLLRGEITPTGKSKRWTINEQELAAKKFQISYDIVADEYTRGCLRIPGWENEVSEASNIFRKIEHDWNMVYLARHEESDLASISWELNLSNTSLSIKTVELKIQSQTFETGNIDWKLFTDNVSLSPVPSEVLMSEALVGSKKLTISAKLSGGKGLLAWQHAQLFRSTMKISKYHGLKLHVTLQDDNKHIQG